MELLEETKVKAIIWALYQYDIQNIIKEFTKKYGDPFYPVPCKKNYEIYEKYKKETEKLKDVMFIGRLAQYKYFNMDQVVREALESFEKQIKI